MVTTIKPGKIAAVVLAAGASTRMGDANKLLAEIDGRPVIECVVRAALSSEADEVIVVTGFESGRIREALAGFAVRFADNPEHGAGLSTSVKAGIGGLTEDTTGAIVLLGDMPRVTPNVIDRLIACFRRRGSNVICRPVFGDKAGNPVLWPHDLFAALKAVDGDRGGRDLLKTHDDRLCPIGVDTDGIFFDIDEPGDLDSAGA